MRVKAVAALLAIVMSAGPASGQAPPPLPPAQPPPAAVVAQPVPPPLTIPPPLTTPPPVVLPPSGGAYGPLPQTTAPVPAPGAVRLHFHMLKDKGRARIAVRTVQGGYAFVCGTPCVADLPPGAELRVTLATSDDEDEDAHLMSVPRDLGSDVDIEIKPASKGGLVGGIIMTSIGGFFALIGVVLLAVAGDEKSNSKTGLVTGGLVCLVLGAGLGIPGVLLISNRSREPRVKSDPYKRDNDERISREDSLLPVAHTPLRLGFSF